MNAGSSVEAQLDNGLINRHAYTITGIYQVLSLGRNKVPNILSLSNTERGHYWATLAIGQTHCRGVEAGQWPNPAVKDKRS